MLINRRSFLLSSILAVSWLRAWGEDAAPLRVMSFNVRYGTAGDGENRWDKRKEMLADTIKAFDPDLLGTQELLAFQGKFLREQLPAYEFFGAGRDDGLEKGEFSAVYFRKERFEKLDGGHFWLSETPDKAGSKSWDAAITRMVTWVKLKDRRSGATFHYFNTHWDHIGQKARLESAKLMRQRIAALGNVPVIVTGDFNTTEDGEPYKVLFGNSGGATKLIDSYRQAHPTRLADEATFHGFMGGRGGSHEPLRDGPRLASDERKGARIDWILHTQHFTTAEAAIDYTNKDGRYPSDHFPVTAVLRLTLR